MASARVRAAAAAEAAALRSSGTPSAALLALRDALVGSAPRKISHAELLPAVLIEGLQRGWSAEHVASVVELIADAAAPPALAPLAEPLLAHLPAAAPGALAPLCRALSVLLPRLDPLTLAACAAHLPLLIARTTSAPASDAESAARVGHVAALLVAGVAAPDEGQSAALTGALVGLTQLAAPAVLVPALRALVALLSGPRVPPAPPTLLAPLWPRLVPLLCSPHPDLLLLASACVATAGPVAHRSRALLCLLRVCSHPLARLRTSAALLAAGAVRGNPTSQSFAAVEAGALLRVEALLGPSSHHEEHVAALTLLAELCSLSDEARAATHALRLLPRLQPLAFPSSPSSPSPSPSPSPPSLSSSAALRCLRLLARGAPFLRSALVESGVVGRAVHAVRLLWDGLRAPSASMSSNVQADGQVLLALLANVLLDVAPAKRLFADAAGPVPVAALAACRTAPPALVRAALLVLRNAAHGADLAAKLALLDALPFPAVCELVHAPHEEVAEAALSLLRNLLHHDASQVMIKMDPAALLAVASLPSHANSLALLLPALYVLCNVAAASDHLRAALSAHEPALALVSAALASGHAAVRVAALWTLHNLTWKHPARSALCTERGFAARLALLRADPVLDVRERACSITWL